MVQELKTFTSERIYWAVEQVEREAGDIDDLHLDNNSFYLKSEADKVISDLEESHKMEVEQLLMEIVKLKEIDSKNRSAYYKDLAMMAKDVEHHKFKRCLAMAGKCHALYDKYSMLAADDANWEEEDYYFARWRFFEKWKYKWLELAEKFKEVK